ncbi:MAG TPA: class I SAM-dependent methyltransferase [Cellvibrio sp.]
MTATALYTDLSGYYDLMCADIDYREQSEQVRRLHQLFGNSGNEYLDLACGTGPHIRHFIDFGYSASGVDINQPMLDIARLRCPAARFFQQDMSVLQVESPLDLISCFLYSIHYNQSIAQLKACIKNVHAALAPGGIFCFNSVSKNLIDNRPGIKRNLKQGDSEFCFQSNWYYPGDGEHQQLQLCIEKTTHGQTETWLDQHPMVALDFQQMQQLLEPYFDVHIFEHNYRTILPWNQLSGNAIFLGIKK